MTIPCTIVQEFIHENWFSSAAVVRPWLASYAELAEINFNSTHVGEYQVSYFPYPIWRNEGMHDLIMQVAKSAADAVAQSGRPMRMGTHVMTRVDIALTRQGNLVRQNLSMYTVYNVEYTVNGQIQICGLHMTLNDTETDLTSPVVVMLAPVYASF